MPQSLEYREFHIEHKLEESFPFLLIIHLSSLWNCHLLIFKVSSNYEILQIWFIQSSLILNHFSPTLWISESLNSLEIYKDFLKGIGK